MDQYPRPHTFRPVQMPPPEFHNDNRFQNPAAYQIHQRLERPQIFHQTPVGQAQKPSPHFESHQFSMAPQPPRPFGNFDRQQKFDPSQHNVPPPNTNSIFSPQQRPPLNGQQRFILHNNQQNWNDNRMRVPDIHNLNLPINNFPRDKPQNDIPNLMHSQQFQNVNQHAFNTNFTDQNMMTNNFPRANVQSFSELPQPHFINQRFHTPAPRPNIQFNRFDMPNISTAVRFNNQSIPLNRFQSHEQSVGIQIKSEEIIPNERDDDKLWVESFTRRAAQCKKAKSKLDVKDKLTISSYQLVLKKCLELKQNLESTINLMIDTNDEEMLAKYRSSAQNLAGLLKRATDFVDSPENLATVSRLVDQRKRKRDRLKRKRLIQNEDRAAIVAKREEQHKVIDNRLDALVQKQLSAKQDRDMKKHADCVKSEVMKKATETNRTIELLGCLRKLRKVRLNSIVSRGINANVPLHEHFESKIGEMLEVMTKQKEVYDSEAKTLEVMLDREHADTKELVESRKRQIEVDRRDKMVKKIERQLFGKQEKCDPDILPYQQYYTQAETNLQSLIMIRNEWDRYLVNPSTPAASRIPDGFIQPENPADQSWTRYLNS